MASIQKKNNKYCVVYYCKDTDGKRKQKWETYDTKNAAKIRKAEIELKEKKWDKDFSVNVISKSGTTTEPAIAFRVFKELLVKKYGQEEANKRIYATTDRAKGAVKVEADANGWDTFVVPDSVGGRFTVLTAWFPVIPPHSLLRIDKYKLIFL